MGSEILLTPKELGTDGAIEEVYKIARENKGKYFLTDQFNNPANWMTHYEKTGKEIIEQTKGDIDYFIGTLGTSGTIMGISRRLKEYNKKIQIIGVEPYLGHKIQGLKNMKEAYTPEIFDKSMLDEKVNIDDEKAFEMARMLAKEEGIFAGMSSGAAVAVAIQYAKKLKKGTIVTIFPDGGDRYLSTELFDLEEKTGINLYNPVFKKKVPFTPINKNSISIFSFGYTAYRRINLDEMRRFIFADFISSYFKYKGFSVKHILNINDLDDKTIEGAKKQKCSLKEFTEKNIEEFFKDLKLLKIDSVEKLPVVSKETDSMIKIAERLYNKGFAYEKLKSLYFNISKFKEYGKLSGVDINKIKLGATVNLDEYEKNNPRDFTLFKRATLSDLKEGVSIKTDWGNVRPTLPLQSVSISTKYLGESFDIYVAPKSLIFPQNENEIAIAKSANQKPFAKNLLHSEKVIRNGKKINEENFTNLDEASIRAIADIKKDNKKDKSIKQTDEIKNRGIDSLRYWILSTHYRKALNFSDNSLKSASLSLNKINRCIKKLTNLKGASENLEARKQILYDIKNGFIETMDDDFNVSMVFANLFKVIKDINLLIFQNALGKDDAKEILAGFKKINSVLKMFEFEQKEIDSEIEDLIKQREIAQNEKNFILADKIRDELHKKNFLIQDKKV